MNAWHTHTLDNIHNHSCSFFSTECELQKLAIEACAQKAISLLDENIHDASLYLLFEWNPACSTLTVVLTDESKQHDAPNWVIGLFPGLDNSLNQLTPSERILKTQAHTELVRFWLYDYLTTCTAFFNYSLVAIFHSSTRDQSELL